MERQEFESKISNLEVVLFDQIKSQTSENDKRSLLDMQNAIRSFKDSYVYLEIGSHLGGSIQPYLLDHKCSKIYSIDKRPLEQPDERLKDGRRYIAKYPDNSTQRMLDNLKRLTADLKKITCFDSDALDIDKNKIMPRPDICLIDGEHTNRKVVSDFEFCEAILNERGVIVFHDADVVRGGIDIIMKGLRKNKTKFKAYFLPSSIFVLDFTQNEMQFKKIQSQNIRFYSYPNFFAKLRQMLRKLSQPVSKKIKILKKHLRSK